MSDRFPRRELLHRARRLSLGLAGLVLFEGCVPTPGQGGGGAPAARVAALGVLTSLTDEADPDDSPGIDQLRQGLRDLGWVEGANVRLEMRSAQGDSAALPDLAAELTRLPVDVVVALGSPATVAAAAATKTLPVVMVQGPPNVVEQGLATSIQRPGGNVTGHVRSPNETAGKNLEVLVEAVPHVSRVACIVQPTAAIAEALRGAARTLGLQVDIFTARAGGLEPILATIERDAADALLVGPGPVTNNNRARIVDFAAQRRLPAIYPTRVWAETGDSFPTETLWGTTGAELHSSWIESSEAPGRATCPSNTRRAMS